jgi:hypothetical protein
MLNYFICIKDLNAETITSLKLNLFSFFICCCQHHGKKRYAFIYFWYQTDSGVPNSSIFSATRHKSIGVFVVYIDTGSWMPNIPSKSRDLAVENTIVLTEWKWFEKTVLQADVYQTISCYVKQTKAYMINKINSTIEHFLYYHTVE